MMKVMIIQPMAGKTDEILRVREAAERHTSLLVDMK